MGCSAAVSSCVGLASITTCERFIQIAGRAALPPADQKYASTLPAARPGAVRGRATGLSVCGYVNARCRRARSSRALEHSFDGSCRSACRHPAGCACREIAGSKTRRLKSPRTFVRRLLSIGLPASCRLRLYGDRRLEDSPAPVSYTHLTLPTSDLV